MGFRQWAGPMLRTHRAGKGCAGVGVGLMLNTAGGAQECLWPWRVEDQVWDPSRLPGPKWAGGNARRVPPDHPILEDPYLLAPFLLRPPLLCP